MTFPFRCIVLTSIYLHNQFCLMTVKIGYEVIDCFLPLKPHGIISKKVIPQVFLLRCHIFAQFFGK